MVLQTLATTHAYDESLPSVLSVLERLTFVNDLLLARKVMTD
ncbi:unnamed protein product [Tenebrio molitor]|nr:unnamed protein product [Tenebrio molitor]